MILAVEASAPAVGAGVAAVTVRFEAAAGVDSAAAVDTGAKGVALV